MKELGTVVERFAPPTIDRKDRERINTVSAILSGAAMSEVVAAAQEKIDQVCFPLGISIQLSGTYEDQQDSFGDLFTLMYLIVILVFIVMAAQFESLTIRLSLCSRCPLHSLVYSWPCGYRAIR